MPRVLKADLVSLVRDLRAQEADSQAEIERLRTENERLRAEKGDACLQRDRSRSPRRVAEPAAKTHRVLNLVQRFERDQVIEEQRATIARQQQEIQDLREGGGPIGEVVLANWRRRFPSILDDEMIGYIKTTVHPVRDVILRICHLSSAIHDYANQGTSFFDRDNI